MAKADITVTQLWALVAAGPVVVTIDKVGSGAIFFDENQNDDTAYKSVPIPGEQFEQTASLETYVRANGDGWKVIVDGVLT